MAIIKYYVEAVTRTDNDADPIASDWQYEEVKNPLKNGKVISREEAHKRIEKQGLVLVHQNMYGAIWDHLDEPFKEKYAGIFSNIKL